MKKLLTLVLAMVIGIPCIAQKWGLVKDEDGYTNVRKGPGTKYEIVDQIPDGMFVSYKSTGTGWHKVYTVYTDGSEPDFLGYMSANKIVTPPRMGELKEVAMVKDEDGYTNIRKGPGTKYAIVGKVRDGGYILINSGSDASWLKVYTQKGKFRGYISANKVVKMESPVF